MSSEESELKEKLLKRTRQMLEATVDEVMTRDVLSCDHEDLCSMPARLILENSVLGILVMKDGKAIGMITQYDLLKLSYEEVFDPERDYLRLKVGKLAEEKEFISVPTGTKLRDALKIMLDRNLRTIPIIDDGLVRGILSLVDMVRWYRDTHDEVRTGQL